MFPQGKDGGDMKTKFISTVILLFICSAGIGFGRVHDPSISEKPVKNNPSLRILTINVWSGLDYKGTFRMGEYEKKAVRRKRFQVLVKEIKKIAPDVIFLQEANPVRSYSARLARALNFDTIHQVCQAGIKLGPLGIPSNLKEGNAILARPELRLKIHDVWKLSGSFGLYGDLLTCHMDESIFALAGRIVVDSTPIFLVNTHLVSSPSPEVAKHLEAMVKSGQITGDEFRRGYQKSLDLHERRKKETLRLMKKIQQLPAGSPVILAGDFNARIQSQELQTLLNMNPEQRYFIDTFIEQEGCGKFTWDPQTNKNIQLSQRDIKKGLESSSAYERLCALDDMVPKRIDYIFLSSHFSPEDIRNSKIVFESTEQGVQVSDHYGVYSEIAMANVLAKAPKSFGRITKLAKSKFEFLPILMWDTDIGFGYGLKLFYLNPLKLSESFDLVLFNSSKGERWYRLVFSWPDFEFRQGRIYPFSLDLMVDYDKYLKNNYFGTGNQSEFDDREVYTREPLEITLTASRGFSPSLVGQIGLRYKTVDNYNFEENSRLINTSLNLNVSRATIASIFTNLRFDTRNSFINPSSGVLIQGEAEFTVDTGFTNVNYRRLSAWFQYYTILFYPKTILAVRFNMQSLFGDDIPVQFLLPIGGGSTLRGSPQDRFLGKSSAIFNCELRFPLVWRFGGVLGFDAGKVWDSPAAFDFKAWATNPTLGLRFYMSNFLVRLDVGLGKDSTGFYFNFGHIF